METLLDRLGQPIYLGCRVIADGPDVKEKYRGDINVVVGFYMNDDNDPEVPQTNFLKLDDITLIRPCSVRVLKDFVHEKMAESEEELA